MRLYWLTPDSPECASVEAAIREWLSSGQGDLPTTISWTDYDADRQPVAQGNTAIKPPYGTIIHWS